MDHVDDHVLRTRGCLSPLAVSALAFASGAHAAVGQKRKYTVEPYIVHPIEVESILFAYSGFDKVTPEQSAAAFLHDVVEDTQVSIDIIDQVFGPVVSRLVSELTDVSKPADGNRATRKAIDLDYYSKISPEAADIKLADLISNTLSIAEHDPNFARVYLKEKQALLNVLTMGSEEMKLAARNVLRIAQHKIYGEVK